MIFKRKIKDKILVCTMVLSLLSVNPIYSFGEEKREVVDIPSGASFYHKEMIGKDRYETSNKILKEMGDKNETVILVNASEIMSDGLSSSALAGKLKANIVPINPKKVNKNTMEKVKKAKTVYLIGGYNAIPKSFESNLKNKKVIRIGGKDRVETSEKIAKYIGSYKKAYIVNGYTGQADAMSISPVAARDLSPIILTKKSNSETHKKDNVEYTVIGGKNAVSEKIRKRFSSKRIDGKDRYETNRNVLKKFYPNRKSISFCNGETLVDALSGTVYAKDEGIALVNRKNNLDLLEYISTSQLGGLPFDVNFVYGGVVNPGGSGGSGGGTGGGTVVPEENKLETPKLEVNITGKYNIDETKGEVILDITNKDKYPQGTKFEYKEINGKEIPTDNLYEVGETYIIQVKAKLNGKESELSNKVEFTVPKKVDEKYATLLSGGEIIENPDKPGEPLLNLFRGKIHEIVGSYDAKIKLKFEEKVPKEEFEKIKKEKAYKTLDVNDGEIIGYLEQDKEGNNVVHIISYKEIKANKDCSFMFTVLNIKSIEGLEKIDTSEVENMSSMFSGCSFEEELDLTGLNISNVKNMESMFEWSNINSLKISAVDTSEVTNMSKMFKGCNVKGNLDLSGLNTSNVTTMESMFEESNINSLKISTVDTSEVTNMSKMFKGCTVKEPLDLSKLDISNVTTMESMFEESNINSLKINTVDTKKVGKNMSKMFKNCNVGESLDLKGLKTTNATNMSEMFYGDSLTSLDISNFDISSATTMESMFEECTVKSLKISTLDTGKVGKNMSKMFKNCNVGESLDLKGLKTTNAINMSEMFYENSLTSLDISNFDTSKVTDMSSMFYYSRKLTSLDISNFNTINVKDMSSMFRGCFELTSLDISNFNTSKVTDMSNMFYDCNDLITLNISSFDTSNVTNMSGMFHFCRKLTNLTLGKFNTTINPEIKDKKMASMFASCGELKELDLQNWKVSNATDMSYMFNGCSNLTTLNLSKWEISNATNMEGMFNYCENLTTLNLSNWKIGDKLNMTDMFDNCKKLTTLDLSSWNTSGVTDMSNMFNGCKYLTTLDLSNWDTGNVTDMSNMFNGCEELITLDLSSWNTGKVTNMSSIFKDCGNLGNLNLSNWNTSQVTDMSSMFDNCGSLNTIYSIDKFDFSSVTNMSSMFQYCQSLNANIYIKNKNAETVSTCDTINVFNRGPKNGAKITIYYNSDNTNVNNFINNNLKANNNDKAHSEYMIEYKEILPTV